MAEQTEGSITIKAPASEVMDVILDYENYLKTRMGESSHAAYKKRQLQAARRRVLQGLI